MFTVVVRQLGPARSYFTLFFSKADCHIRLLHSVKRRIVFGKILLGTKTPGGGGGGGGQGRGGGGGTIHIKLDCLYTPEFRNCVKVEVAVLGFPS